MIIQSFKTDLALHASFMNNLVDVIGGDTGLGLAGGNIQHLTCKPADLAHTILLLLCEDLDPVPASKDLSCSQP